MKQNLPSLDRLLKQLQVVPYLASKNLYKVANFLLEMDQERAKQFCEAIIHAKKNILHCSECFAWREKNDECVFCTSKKRDRSIVCVIETWQDLIAVEKTGGYNGLYHVLCGVIYPLEGVGPEDLTINSLIKRLENNKDIQEIILATNQSPEGEATAAYISQKLKNFDIKISCLARGIPVGSSLELMDKLTVYKALSDRRPY